ARLAARSARGRHQRPDQAGCDLGDGSVRRDRDGHADHGAAAVAAAGGARWRSLRGRARRQRARADRRPAWTDADLDRRSDPARRYVGGGGAHRAARARAGRTARTARWRSGVADLSVVLPIETRASILDLGLVRHRPTSQRHYRLRQAAPEIGELVVDPWRNGRKYSPRDQSIALEPAQGQRQHPLRDAANHALDLVEALRAVAEHHDHEHAPFIADAGEDGSDTAAVAVEMRLRRQDGHIFVRGSHGCARVSKLCVLARVWHSHSYSASYKPIPRVTSNETAPHR